MTFDKRSAYEFILLAVTIWRESRDQGELGMRAVGWSIRNRVMDARLNWWGNDWEEVALKPWQYEANMPVRQVPLPGDPAKDPSWALALDVAEGVYLGTSTNPVKDATHYYAPKLVSAPNWTNAPGSRFVCDIGGHRFYKAA